MRMGKTVMEVARRMCTLTAGTVPLREIKNYIPSGYTVPTSLNKRGGVAPHDITITALKHRHVHAEHINTNINQSIYIPVTITFSVAFVQVSDGCEVTTPDWQVYWPAWDVRSARNLSST